jgi:hypothetical protein
MDAAGGSLDLSDPEAQALWQEAEAERRAIVGGRRQAALDSGDWEGYIDSHESHERLPAFIQLLADRGNHVTDREYWRLLAAVWTGHDVVYRDLPTWRWLFRSNRGERHHLMTEPERARYAELPDRVTVHRGSGQLAGRHGIAWTLDHERAVFFARDFPRSPRLRWLGIANPTGAYLATVTVRRERIIAWLDHRGEDELLIPDLRGYRPSVTVLS